MFTSILIRLADSYSGRTDMDHIEFILGMIIGAEIMVFVMMYIDDWGGASGDDGRED